MDWIEQALKDDEVLQNTWVPSDQSSTWNKFGVFQDEQVTENTFRRLSDLKATFSNFATVLGRPDIEFRFTRDPSLGTACAFFNDTKNWLRPVVVTSLDMLQLCQQSLDPLIGTILHEIAHILYTRKLFRLTTRHKLAQGLGQSFANLLEDYRIERALAATAPGYEGYLQSARHSLLLERWLKMELDKWPLSNTFSRLITIIAAFIRFPRMFRLKPEMMSWQSPDGVVFFNRVRRILKRAPHSENDVLRLARKLLDLFPKGYPLVNLPSCLNVKNAAEMKPEFIFEAEDDINQQKETVSVSLPLPNRPLPNLCSEVIALERAVKAEKEMPEWGEARHELRDQIACLREKLVQSHPRQVLVGGQKRGVLDSRSLYKATFDSHIFGRRELRFSNRQERFTVSLLLDSSGSMYEKNRITQALKMAVLLYEGLKPTMNVRIYSHFFCHNVTVIEHAEPNFSLQNYRPHGGNIDSQAILLLGSILQSERGKKLLFVISDGLPNNMGDKDGVTATREAVQDVRALGIPVAGVNIGDEFDKSIYHPFQIHVPDASQLPVETAKLVLTELRKLWC